MKNIKDELQNIILRNEQTGPAGQLQKVQIFLRGYAEAGIAAKEQQYRESEEAALLIFAESENLFYPQPILDIDFISEGAEQKVYRFDDSSVIKTNGGIFYECWLDYFDSLIIHNYFFPATAYTFLGFKMIANNLHAVVKQEFIAATESTNLVSVKELLEYNGFRNNRNNDYINEGLGIIFEDLHDENVLSADGVLFFIDTVFYLTPSFYTIYTPLN